MKIYRLEHMGLINDKFGGPAGPYADAVWMNAEHADDIAEAIDNDEFFWCCSPNCTHSKIEHMCGELPDHRPAPRMETGSALARLMCNFNNNTTDFIFGFDSMESLMVWFVDDLWWLEEAGYVIATYEVDSEHVHEGYRQLVFDYRAATRTGEFN